MGRNTEERGWVNRVHLRFLSLADNVGLARVSVAALAGQGRFSLSDIEEIKVAVSEAVSNAIIHGYQRRTDGWVELDLELDDAGLTIVVEDWGVGIEDIEQARQPSYSGDPERMGLGFVFMESFMHGLEVESTLGQGTRVQMRRLANVSGELSRDAQ
ncbi:MAG: anti-sigma F factor [Sulfobacillus acidophilus]|uniref:Anti-sigma F factor n=1 Tax=Sulfobacillus acidophilus TaxID=53633 RepID=A0A2T2WKU1_9FIRM|nr:MAG: anti-sigma F factor [Sulfobacillus acidophilus]